MERPIKIERERQRAKLVSDLKVAKAERALIEFDAGHAMDVRNFKADEAAFKQENFNFVEIVIDSKEGVPTQRSISRTSGPPHFIIDLSLDDDNDDDDDIMKREEEPTDRLGMSELVEQSNITSQMPLEHKATDMTVNALPLIPVLEGYTSMTNDDFDYNSHGEIDYN